MLPQQKRKINPIPQSPSLPLKEGAQSDPLLDLAVEVLHSSKEIADSVEDSVDEDKGGEVAVVTVEVDREV